MLKTEMIMKRIMLLVTLCLSVFVLAQTGQAPDFVLPDLNGKNYKLSEKLGKGPVLINFWATWCVPCQEEMKKLKEIYKQYEKDGLAILSISLDDPKTLGKVKSFVNTNRHPFKFLLDADTKVFKLYQGANMPFTILLDKQGQIVYTHTGYRKGDEKKLETKIAQLIQKD
jgi:peroxiredoxin